MKNISSVMTVTRLIAVLVGIGLLCAPFSANCCALSSCEPSTAASASGQPHARCHGNMRGQSSDSSVCLKNMPSCTDSCLALVPARTDEVSGKGDLQTKLQMSGAVREQTAGHFDLSALNSWKLKSPERNLHVFSALSPTAPLKI